MCALGTRRRLLVADLTKLEGVFCIEKNESVCHAVKNTVYSMTMQIWDEHIDKNTLRRTDPMLYEFLMEYERTDGRMDETESQKTRNLKKVEHRIKMTNLRRLRTQRHMTQACLARTSGVSTRTITAIENGHNIPSVFAALVLASALGVKVEEVFYIGAPDEPVSDFTTGQATRMKR